MVGKAISLTALGTGRVSKISLLLTFAIAVTLLDASIYMLKKSILRLFVRLETILIQDCFRVDKIFILLNIKIIYLTLLNLTE